MATAIRSGLTQTLPAIAGLQMALIILLAIVAAGLGAILATSEVLFTLLKWTGAAYLILLGIMKWREAGQSFSTSSQTAPCRKRSFANAILVNLTNPKAIVFLAAFLPQFVDPAQKLWPQYLIMGITMVVIDMLVMLGYATFALKLLPVLKRSAKLQNKLFGSMFILCGGLLAVSHR